MTTVLLVGHPDDLETLGQVLRAAGCRTAHAAALDDVATSVVSERPDVILGRAAPSKDEPARMARRLKEQAGSALIPLLVLVGRGDDVAALGALEAGADDVAESDALPALIVARLRRLHRVARLRAVVRLDEHFVQVGRLLTGVVHEIRGPLSVIRGSAELMRLQLESTDALHSWIEPILRNAEVLKVRLEHLMASVRGGPPQLQVVDLRSLISEALSLFLKGVDRRGCVIRVEARTEGETPPIARADPGRFLLVLLSLLNNAHEAMVAAEQARGTVGIGTSIVSREGSDWAMVTLQDDGPGIPPEHVDRIFEPFFSTKEHGSGYGLYLAVETMKEQGGRITVASTPGHGACFTLWLPVASNSSHSATA